MKRIIQKTLVILAVCLLQVQISDACSINSFTINDSGSTTKVCIGTSVSVRASGSRTAGCALDIEQFIDIIDAPAGSDPTITLEDPDEISYSMIFNKAGSYTLRYTFKDAPSCSNTTPCIETKTIEVVNPRARFISPSIKVCKGDQFNVDVEFMGATDATVRRFGDVTFIKGVSPSANNIGNVEYNIPVSSNFKLYIVRASNSGIPNCLNEELLDSIAVIALDKPEAVPIWDGVEGTPLCDDSNENYIMKYKLRGGDNVFSLITQGEAEIVGGDTLITNIRPSGEAFSIMLNSGETCGDFEVSEMYECACDINAGAMPGSSFSNCQDATIILDHDITNLNTRGIDNLLFVLHADPNPGESIENILSWSDKPEFDLPGIEFVDSLLYVSAVVGPYNVNTDSLDLDVSSCKNITPGTPVEWISNDKFNIAGKTEVCAFEQNRMYTIENDSIKDGSQPNWVLKDNSGAFIEAQNSERIFLSFIGNATSTLYYETNFRINDELSCITVDSIQIEVDPNESAEPESKIILWPGDILASTSDGPCYQWGSIPKFGDFRFNLFDGANEKYYYSPVEIKGSELEDNTYFVAIFDSENCEFSLENCNSIIFYNSDGLLPGLSIKDADDFNIELSPNPNDGFISIEISGSYKGLYKVEVFNEIGQILNDFQIDKYGNYHREEMDLSQQSEGLYFVVISNEFGKKLIIKTIIAR